MNERPGHAESSDPPAAAPTGGAGVVCGLCGSAAPFPPLTWMYEADRSRGGRWYCQSCARRHLRAVEAKLEPEWW